MTDPRDLHFYGSLAALALGGACLGGYWGGLGGWLLVPAGLFALPGFAVFGHSVLVSIGAVFARHAEVKAKTEIATRGTPR